MYSGGLNSLTSYQKGDIFTKYYKPRRFHAAVGLWSTRESRIARALSSIERA